MDRSVNKERANFCYCQGVVIPLRNYSVNNFGYVNLVESVAVIPLQGYSVNNNQPELNI